MPTPRPVFVLVALVILTSLAALVFPTSPAVAGAENPPARKDAMRVQWSTKVMTVVGKTTTLLEETSVRQWSWDGPPVELMSVDTGLCNPTGLAVLDGAVFVIGGSIESSCQDKIVQVFGPLGYRLQSWCPRLQDGDPCRAQYLAAGSGRLYVTSGGRILAYDPHGTPLGSASVPGRSVDDTFRAIATGPDGTVYVLDRTPETRVWKFSADLDFLGDVPLLGTQLIGPGGIAIGPDGSIYLSDGERQTYGSMVRFDPDGVFHSRVSQLLEPPGGVAVDGDGYVYFATHQDIVRFENFPAPGRHDPAVALHVTPVVSPRTACDAVPTPGHLITQGAAGPGTLAYVYVLASPNTHPSLDTDTQGLTGLRLGIEYTSSSLEMYGWYPCTGAQTASAGWPESKGGKTVVWTECLRDEVIPVGYFYIGAYAPGALVVTGYPGVPGLAGTGEVTATDCNGAASAIDTHRLGWVSLGGKSVAGSSAGCNPFCSPCTSESVPVLPITWGRLKKKY